MGNGRRSPAHISCQLMSSLGRTYKDGRHDFVLHECDLQQVANNRRSVDVDLEPYIVFCAAKNHGSYTLFVDRCDFREVSILLGSVLLSRFLPAKSGAGLSSG
jgi:hypothetical protein